MKKSVILLVVLTLIAVFLSACSKNHYNVMVNNGILTVGINMNYPPMEYYADDGITPVGFDVSLAKALAQDMKLDIRFEDTAWESIFSSLESKKYDCIISSVTITKERQGLYYFSNPYIKNALVLVMSKAAEKKISSPSALAGHDIAYQEGTTASDYMAALQRRGLKFNAYEYSKMTQCFDDLRLGRVDAVLTDLVVAHHYLAASDRLEIVWQGEEEVFGICFKKSDIVLLNRVNKSLDKLYANGTLLNISKENFNGMDLVSTVR